MVDMMLNVYLLMVVNVIGGLVGVMVVGVEIIGQLIDLVKCVVCIDVIVFINGLIGSGKEVLVCQVYNLFCCVDKLFVVINCVVILENMFEVILFGYEKGVFIGVVVGNKGIICVVDGGILLLDEILEMLMGFQLKLLCVL